MNLSWLRRQLANGVLPNECDESGADDVQLFQQSLHVVSRSHSLTVGQSAVIHESKLVEAPVTTTTLDPAGMTLNAAGDLSAFILSFLMYGGAFAGIFCAFPVVRRMFPMIYANNVLEGWAPQPRPDNVGLIQASIRLSVADVAESVGLDHALLLEFLHLGMKILLCYGTPMLLIMGPMNCFLGGNAAGEDHLSYLSFGNVEWDSWLYWIHAFCVWGVVFSVQVLTYRAQERFLEMRFEWLRAMADVRANTVLVEDIPPQHRSDEALRKYFNKLFGGKVKSAYCVKDVTTLAALEQQRQIARDALRLAEAKWQQAGGGEDARPTLKKSFMGERVDSIRYYTSLLEELKPQIKAEKRRITEEAAKGAGGVNLQNGFVTFTDRSTAEVALRLDLTPDQDEWCLSTPPQPFDVLWRDLMQDPNAERTRTLFGYLIIAGLYFAYMPIVIGVTNLAIIINLGPFQPLWQSVAPTLGLLFMVSFLPTFIIWTFKLFFTLKAEAWSQQKLQKWYFWFQIVFVILLVAIGQDIVKFTQTLFTDPFGIIMVCAETMPFATHFFMNYVVLQFLSEGTALLRMAPLFKFITFSRLFDYEEARQMAEPEDQDYFGIGSRSAQFATVMVIGIVFGTLSPPIPLLCFINLAVKRLVYGYLFCFAESKKGDLGGVFWATSLKHLFYCNIIYQILMAGVLYQRSTSVGPCIIAALSIVYTVWSLKRFDERFLWEKLPFQEVMEPHPDQKKRVETHEYVQPEIWTRRDEGSQWVEEQGKAGPSQKPRTFRGRSG